jgi:Cupin-like domain
VTATAATPRAAAGGRRGGTPSAAAGVFVLGMHRSGTSATTRVVNLLGVPTCDAADLWGSLPGNPTGYWESGSLTRFDEGLLAELGAAWYWPPAPELAGTLASRLAHLRPHAQTLFRQLHRASSWVWKDPRLCLTLPFWRDALDDGAAAVLVLRQPLEIAASLEARDGLPRPWALALWERYLRNALVHLAGMRVLVVEYEALLDDPIACAAETHRFLAAAGIGVDEPPVEDVSGFVRRELRHTAFAPHDLEGGVATAAQRELYALTRRLVGAHDSFRTPELPGESQSTTDLFAAAAARCELEIPTGGGRDVSATDVLTETVVSPEWRGWLAENLMLQVPDEALVAVMRENGIDEETAGETIASVRSDPTYVAGSRIAQRLRKLESVLDIQRDLGALDSRNTSVPMRTGVSRAEFLTHYYAANRPVILTDLTDGWPARTLWTPAYLRERCGDASVEVMTDRETDDDYELNSERHRRSMRFAEYVDRIEASGTSNDIYLVANNHFFERPGVSTLWNDFTLPDYLDPHDVDGTVFFWFGPGGTITPLHHDIANVLFVQVYGRKRITLIPALQTHRVYNDIGVFSHVDPDHPDEDAYPQFAGVTKADVVLEPGESLFIPVGWWHRVEALDVSISLSFTNFAFPNSYDWQHPAIAR